ncbi:MAG: UDP-glucose/GDP-mannose dehydrogenase family protein [Patescibacteria group bacterium]|nr:UDP-glucose/GDP-mannose dehydrogenase family protein [Patescibacteria group bacterium]
MTITIVGHGYVGLVTACVFAHFGNTVWVIGRNPEKLKRLKGGDPIIFEPGLEELLKKNLSAGRILFTDAYDQAIPASEIVFTAVGTPPKAKGEADLSMVLQVAENIGRNLRTGYTVVSCKSTVPVGTNLEVKKVIDSVKPDGAEVDVASCPEFLREGTGINDTLYPDRVVIGTQSQKAAELLLRLHEPLPGTRVVTDLASAELIKYASNAMLATKISFANLMSFYCEACGADVEEVLEAVGLDARIGREFLYPGLGYGGSCLPKDVKAIVTTGMSLNIDTALLDAVEEVNIQAKQNFIRKIFRHIAGKRVALWGLAFKPDTDDIRFAPSLDVLDALLKEGYDVHVYDAEAMDNIRLQYHDKITYHTSAYDAVKSADGLCILTEWNEFKNADLEKVKSLLASPVIIDGRNLYRPDKMQELGFTYISTGRVPVTGTPK